jgi:hypothetical protein
MYPLVDLSQLAQTNRRQWLISQFFDLAVLYKVLPPLLSQSQEVHKLVHEVNQMHELTNLVVGNHLQL